MRILAQIPDEISFNAAISAAEKAGQWEHALQLLANMSAEAVNPSTISYNAAISACAKPGEWEVALALLAVMSETGLPCDEITFNCVSNACEKAGRWQLALELLLQKQSPTKVGALVYRICSREGRLEWDDLRVTPAEASQVVWRLAKLSRLGAGSSGLAKPARRVAAAVRADDFELQELSAVLWSLGRLGGLSDSDSLTQQLSKAAFRQMEGGANANGAKRLSIRSMANLAWALSNTDTAGTLGQLQNELACRSLRLPSQSMSQASWTEFFTAAFAILYAAHFAGQLLPNAAQTVRSALVRQGARLDGAERTPALPLPKEKQDKDEELEGGARDSHPEPCEPWAQELRGALLVRKPPHWQVDERDAMYEAEQFFDDRGLLSNFVRAMKPYRQCPILQQTSHQRGFLHRLDVPSSGLILVSTSFETFFDLKFQLATGLLMRGYIILCHGLLNPSRSGIRSPINWLSFGPDSNRASLVQDAGRPSRTSVRSLAQAFHGHRAFTLVHVQIMTGRRHQIRVHTCYIGHPTLTDGKYSSTSTYAEDLAWWLGEKEV